MEAILMQDLYEPDIQEVLQTENCLVYHLENDGGTGAITRYAVYPGIELMYNDIHLESCRQNKRARQNIMEINHCREGRFECEFRNGTYAYLAEGDLAINMLTNKPNDTWFPLSHYHGISVVIDMEQAEQTIAAISAALDGVAIDPKIIRSRLCGDDSCFIMRAEASIQHIFSELYTAPEHLRMGYFKLKILELLLFLGAVEMPSQFEERQYFHKDQVAVIKEIKEYMTEHLDKHFTLSELSQRFDIPLTAMKLCFKGVYGSPIYTYMISYRMQTAAVLLRQTKESITAIGMKLGYSNSSKFSEAFKKAMGMTPQEYRKNNCLIGVSLV